MLFLAKFLALYLAGNLLYGLYVESFDERPDAVTHLVSAQTSWVLNLTGNDTSIGDVAGAPKVALMEEGDVVLNVFEGCNGINVMIVFIAFLFAFGGPLKVMAVFIPAGLLVIHLFNLLRIGLLFHLASEHATTFYYYHKYFFTATLYLVIFGLWALWVMRFNKKSDREAVA